MKKLVLFLIVLSTLLVGCGNKSKENKGVDENNIDSLEQTYIKADIYETTSGPLKVTLVGHASVMFEFEGKVIHVDPYSQVADYSKLPKADLILITHEHADHLDTTAINLIKKGDTELICTKAVRDVLGYGKIMVNGEVSGWNSVFMVAVPAYNIVNKKSDGEAYHPMGRGNGYILTMADKRVYIAGDTENIPEMETFKGAVKGLGDIHIAFLPKNLPYTMTDDMFIDAAKMLQPHVLYPYHMSDFDEGKIGKALDGLGIELKVRPMKNL